MDCCDISHKIPIPENDKKIVLVGNPNVGKSIFFNAFTGIYVSVSNYPGTTLDISTGKYKDYVIIDTPGVYGVSSFNDEERVARDVILSADIVVNIVDALHLERDLFLTQQIIDMNIPVIVALNMMDEAIKNGLNIDVKALSKELGVPVIPTVAINGSGLDEVKESIDRATRGHTTLDDNLRLKNLLYDLSDKIGRQAALLVLEGDPYVSQMYGVKALDYREEIYTRRRERVNEIIRQTVSKKEKAPGFKEKLGSIMLNPLGGIPLLFLTLYALYQLIGVFVAQTVVGFTEEILFLGIYEPFIIEFISRFIEPSSFLGQLLIGEFGVLTMAVTYIFGLLLPLVVGFYLFLSILEDSGYMPRIAVLVDRVLNYLGLNGRAIIPMLLGFGCVTMATITTRLLGSRRERIIAIFLLGLAIPCSAQLGVIAGLIAPLGFNYLLTYIATITVVYVIAGTALNKVLPGKSTDLLIDLPPLRVPIIKNVLKKTLVKSKSFIKEAGPIFVLGSIVITLLQTTGTLPAIQNMVAPVTEGLLKLPPESATAFIMGIVRRDFGAAGLNSMSLSSDQTLVALITLTLFVPCIAAMMIMIKERNWKEAVLIWLGSWVTAFGVGGLIAYIL
ncbi:ferrous iron transport protein B [Halothermothrix orenii]|uniref:Ferrous iron transport protein B n=1 Tax=Halothermothrix orenii (strain H 168 / OCM 544 / DSM 9562) TaxID=373903 RepID=B8CXR6_HALOH|nr:ferrous iron transport protein B [Halothermothrix orenii]ACL70085.1 ferrous iron transport protein FeoB [Halothermothrix orenii H 168]